MKLKTLQEAKYAGKKSISNLLTFFEEEPNEVMGHQTFELRDGLVCYYFEDEIHTIENQNGDYLAIIERGRHGASATIHEENIDALSVHELRKVF